MASTLQNMTVVGSGMVRTRFMAMTRPAPSLFFLPGIDNSRRFWESKGKDEFSWIQKLEDNASVIRDEYSRLRETGRQSDYKLSNGEAKLHEGDWKWQSLILKGKWQPEMVERCPETARLLKEFVPEILEDMPMSYCFFSTLGPGSTIAPHFGPCNVRLRCHLGLKVPHNESIGSGTVPKCGIRVGNEWRNWSEGKALLFDDSYEHETRNLHAHEERVVLLFDIWHPDVTTEERRAFITMFENN